MMNTTTCQDKKILPYSVMAVKGLVQDFVHAVSNPTDYHVVGACYGKILDTNVDTRTEYNWNNFIVS